jgi:hypothetical protein
MKLWRSGTVSLDQSSLDRMNVLSIEDPIRDADARMFRECEMCGPFFRSSVPFSH